MMVAHLNDQISDFGENFRPLQLLQHDANNLPLILLKFLTLHLTKVFSIFTLEM
jgi:hypothetical protein